MATFLFFGKYSRKALAEVTAERTDKAAALIKKCGGELKAGYALLGEYDLVLIAELPGVEEAIKASVGLVKLTGIAFTTMPALAIEAFDKLVS